jgi:transposase
MTTPGCSRCEATRAELVSTRARADALSSEVEQLRRQLHEVQKLADLQSADIERYKKAILDQKEPHYPERVHPDQLQLAMERVIEGLTDPAAKKALEDAATEEKSKERKPPKTSRPHGRRKLDLTDLPVQDVRITPEEVKACGGAGWKLIGEETSDRLGYRRAAFVRIRVTREKWVRSAAPSAEGEPPVARIAIADVPDALWARSMADTSVIAEIILSKYDYSLPLNRQERITKNRGFVIPRSTQAGWLDQTYELTRHLVDAMHAESLAKSFCIATDATGAPVRARGACDPWHVFVFISNLDHVTFRHSHAHTSAAIDRMLSGYGGRLLSDASSIYDALYRRGVIGHSDWVHFRRYLWRAVLTEPRLAHEGIAILHRLFAVGRAVKALPADQRTAFRATRAKPILDVLDGWVERARSKAEQGGRLAAAMTYYLNQRTSLHRFLEDGRINLDNNGSERELRNLVLGIDNWKHFENATGLAWYCTFRSLIASTAVQGINPHDYLTQMLRLIPHWPKPRVIELAPKYWRSTVERLDEYQRAIIVPPWEQATAPPRSACPAAVA